MNDDELLSHAQLDVMFDRVMDRLALHDTPAEAAEAIGMPTNALEALCVEARKSFGRVARGDQLILACVTLGLSVGYEVALTRVFD